MRVWLVENDFYVATKIRQTLISEFAGLVVLELPTEVDFRAELASKREPPDLVVLDVMFQWAMPGQNIGVVPLEVRRDGHYKAGLRCLELLRETSDVPVVFFTALAERDLGSVAAPNVYYVSKNPTDLRPLIQRVRHVAERLRREV